MFSARSSYLNKRVVSQGTIHNNIPGGRASLKYTAKHRGARIARPKNSKLISRRSFLAYAPRFLTARTHTRVHAAHTARVQADVHFVMQLSRGVYGRARRCAVNVNLYLPATGDARTRVASPWREINVDKLRHEIPPAAVHPPSRAPCTCEKVSCESRERGSASWAAGGGGGDRRGREEGLNSARDARLMALARGRAHHVHPWTLSLLIT